jgi:hypothetical protein
VYVENFKNAVDSAARLTAGKGSPFAIFLKQQLDAGECDPELLQATTVPAEDDSDTTEVPGLAYLCALLRTPLDRFKQYADSLEVDTTCPPLLFTVLLYSCCPPCTCRIARRTLSVTFCTCADLFAAHHSSHLLLRP